MAKLIYLTAAAGIALGVVGCAPSTQVAKTGDLLTQSGFMVRVADKPSRVEQMNRLPPKFVTRVRNGQLVYLYADPTGCNCVYLGSQQSWDNYRQKMAAQRAKQEEMSAMQSREELDNNVWALPRKDTDPAWVSASLVESRRPCSPRVGQRQQGGHRRPLNFSSPSAGSTYTAHTSGGALLAFELDLHELDR